MFLFSKGKRNLHINKKSPQSFVEMGKGVDLA